MKFILEIYSNNKHRKDAKLIAKISLNDVKCWDIVSDKYDVDENIVDEIEKENMIDNYRRYLIIYHEDGHKSVFCQTHTRLVEQDL